MNLTAFLRIIKTGTLVLLTLSLFIHTDVKGYTAGSRFSRPNPLSKVNKWFILLDPDPGREDLDLSRMSEFDMGILDPDSHPPTGRSKEDILMIAYLSIGEAEDYRDYWKKIKDKEWVIRENPDWEGNYYVDVRSEEWKKIVIDEVIPGIIKKGFKGIMLDTIDTASMLEDEEGTQFAGSREEMIELISRIHERYPDLYLISNNGFSVLYSIGPFISGMLVEDINTMIDFENEGYKKVPAGERANKIKELKKVKRKYRLPVFNIDYASQGDKRGRRRCIYRSRRLGFKPYVAEGELDRIYKQ